MDAYHPLHSMQSYDSIFFPKCHKILYFNVARNTLADSCFMCNTYQGVVLCVYNKTLCTKCTSKIKIRAWKILVDIGYIKIKKYIPVVELTCNYSLIEGFQSGITFH